MISSGDFLYGAGIVLSTWTANTITQLRAERKRRTDARTAAEDAAAAVKLAAEVARHQILDTARLAAVNASTGAAAGAANALNGTATAVTDIKALLTGHIQETRERFSEQGERFAGIEAVLQERGGTLDRLDRKVDALRTPLRRTADRKRA